MKTFNGTVVDVSQTKLFLIIINVTCISFCVFLFFDHIPMCYRMWKEAEAKDKPDRPFFDGLEDSMMLRVLCRSSECWTNDWLWMAAYFSGGVWTSLFMATGPRVHLKVDRSAVPKSGLKVGDKKVSSTKSSESKKNK